MRGSYIKTPATEVGKLTVTTDLKKKVQFSLKIVLYFQCIYDLSSLETSIVSLRKWRYRCYLNSVLSSGYSMGDSPFKRYSNSQAIEKKFQFPTLSLNFFGWGGVKKHTRYFSTTVLLSKVILHTLKGWKEYLHFEMTRPSRLALYKNKELGGNGGKREGKLPYAQTKTTPSKTTIFAHHSIC